MNGLLRTRVSDLDGIWSRQDAIELGHDDADLREWVKGGEALAAARGAYYVWEQVPASDPDRFATLVRRRMRATARLLNDQFALSHASAVTYHGIARLERLDLTEPVHVMATTSSAWSRRDEVRVHRAIPGTKYGRFGGIAVVAPADAVAGYACQTGLEAGVVAADSALHRGMATKDQLKVAFGRMRRRTGAGVLPAVLAAADARSESVGETRTRLLCRSLGIAVTPQAVIKDLDGEFVARVDFLVDGTSVVLEFDGMVKYRGEGNENSLVDEKRREHRLGKLGYTVIRITWQDLADPAALSARIRATLAAAR